MSHEIRDVYKVDAISYRNCYIQIASKDGLNPTGLFVEIAIADPLYQHKVITPSDTLSAHHHHHHHPILLLLGAA